MIKKLTIAFCCTTALYITEVMAIGELEESYTNSPASERNFSNDQSEAVQNDQMERKIPRSIYEAYNSRSQVIADLLKKLRAYAIAMNETNIQERRTAENIKERLELVRLKREIIQSISSLYSDYIQYRERAREQLSVIADFIRDHKEVSIDNIAEKNQLPLMQFNDSINRMASNALHSLDLILSLMTQYQQKYAEYMGNIPESVVQQEQELRAEFDRVKDQLTPVQTDSKEADHVNNSVVSEPSQSEGGIAQDEEEGVTSQSLKTISPLERSTVADLRSKFESTSTAATPKSKPDIQTGAKSSVQSLRERFESMSSE